MNSICARFWWGDTQEKNKLHYSCWEDLCRSKEAGGLGFRELARFNKALVAKLAWHMWQGADKGWVRLLQGKYCKNIEFQRVEPKGDDSWFWKGLLKARSLVEDYAIKVVGNGTDIDIWQDPWVPNLENSKPKPPDDLMRAPKRVCELIDWDQNCWKEHMLATWFDETEQDAIKNIRIPLTPCSDSWKWRLNLKGEFTVKEAYHTSVHTGRSDDQELRKTIWRVNTSNRDKLLLWRIAAKVIPTRENIQSRIINIDMRCPSCDHNEESNIHCFFLCPLAKGMWFNILGLRVDAVQFSSLKQWLLFLFKRHSSEVWNGWEIGKMAAIILKQIWKARNESWINTKDMQDPYRMTMLINQSKELYWEREAANQELHEILPNPTIDLKWKPPQASFFKCNTDASLKDQTLGIAAIIRKNDKSWIRGECLFFQSRNKDIADAELSAIELAIRIARTHGWRNLVVESDCQLAVKACNKPDLANWQWRSRAEAIKRWLVENSNCSIRFFLRTMNVTAHVAANFARIEQFNGVLELDSLPPDIRRAVQGDSEPQFEPVV